MSRLQSSRRPWRHLLLIAALAALLLATYAPELVSAAPTRGGKATNKQKAAPKKKDFYQVLGVPRNANDKALKKAYLKLAKKLHPDKNQGDEEAAAQFAAVANAYETLSDPQKRAIYDQHGEEGLKAGGPPGGGPGGSGGFGGGGFQFHTGGAGGGAGGFMDPMDLFRQMFGGGGAGGGGMGGMGGMGGRFGGGGGGGMGGGGGGGLYPKGQSSVVELTSANWPFPGVPGSAKSSETTAEKDAVWLVEFYSPNCGHCRNMAKDYAETAAKLKGVVKVAAVNCAAENALCSHYNVQGFPTIKAFPFHRHDAPVDYEGQRTSAAMAAWAVDQVPNYVATVAAKDVAGYAVKKPFLPHVLLVLPHGKRPLVSPPLRALAKTLRMQFRFYAVEAPADAAADTPAAREFRALLADYGLVKAADDAAGASKLALPAVVARADEHVSRFTGAVKHKEVYEHLKKTHQQWKAKGVYDAPFAAAAVLPKPKVLASAAAVEAFFAGKGAGYRPAVLVCPAVAAALAKPATPAETKSTGGTGAAALVAGLRQLAGEAPSADAALAIVSLDGEAGAAAAAVAADASLARHVAYARAQCEAGHPARGIVWLAAHGKRKRFTARTPYAAAEVGTAAADDKWAGGVGAELLQRDARAYAATAGRAFLDGLSSGVVPSAPYAAAGAQVKDEL